MRIIRNPVALDALWSGRESGFEDMIKIVVDVGKDILAADAELHADLESALLDSGSRQEPLWGANVYPLLGKTHPGFIEHTALVTIRPSGKNASMEIEDPSVRARVQSVVLQLLA